MTYPAHAFTGMAGRECWLCHEPWENHPVSRVPEEDSDDD